MIAVIVEGGIVQSVCSAGVPVRYVVVDYDADGDDMTVEVPQSDGTTSEAWVSYPAPADMAGPFVLQAFTLGGDADANCPACGGLGAFPATGETCDACLGGGVKLNQ